MALAAGTKLGPYEILAMLGAGGMGEVYSTAHLPFTGRYLHAGHDYETDGRRFLLMKSAEQKGPASLQVVLNWTTELKK